jgi:hypothetical protein
MSGYISGAPETEGPPSAFGAARNVVNLSCLDVHAADEDDIGPGEIGGGCRRNVLVDETHRPVFRHVGRNDKQALRRHECPHVVH